MALEVMVIGQESKHNFPARSEMRVHDEKGRSR
jgi:hypothetical protein